MAFTPCNRHSSFLLLPHKSTSVQSHSLQPFAVIIMIFFHVTVEAFRKKWLFLGSISHSPREHLTNGQRRQLLLLHYLVSWVAAHLSDTWMLNALAAMWQQIPGGNNCGRGKAWDENLNQLKKKILLLLPRCTSTTKPSVFPSGSCTSVELNVAMFVCLFIWFCFFYRLSLSDSNLFWFFFI